MVNVMSGNQPPGQSKTAPMGVKRLDKLLADAGFGSRKDVRHLVKAGRVTVDGAPAYDPACKIRLGATHVEVDGRAARQHPLTLMLHKPTGVVTATSDARHTTVLDLVPPTLSRHLFPAGRLDKETDGLLILTEDGALCHRLISPKHGIEKEYIATVSGSAPPDLPQRFAQGITLADGWLTKPARLTWLDPGTDENTPTSTPSSTPLITPSSTPSITPSSTPSITPSSSPSHTEDERKLRRARVVLVEGRYHQVRRMFAACGLRVVTLTRVRMGGVRLDPALRPGAYRELTAEERARLLINP